MSELSTGTRAVATRAARDEAERKLQGGDAALRPASAPDYYMGSYEKGEVIASRPATETLPVAEFVMKVAVRPPIERQDQRTLEDEAMLPEGMLRGIVRVGDASEVYIAHRGFQPQRFVAEWAVDALNEAREWRLRQEVQAQAQSQAS